MTDRHVVVRSLTALLAGTIAIVLSGCVPSAPEPVNRPAPPLACDELAAPDLISALAGPAALEREPDLLGTPDGAPFGDGLSRAAVLQAGGMLCEWAPEGASPFEPTVMVAGLTGVDVASFAPYQELERHNPGAVTYTTGEATLTVRCFPGYESPPRCQWVAWSGDVVVEALLADAPETEYELPAVQPDPTQDLRVLAPVLDSPGARLVTGALAALLAVSDGAVRDVVPPLSCEEIIPTDERTAWGRPFWLSEVVFMPRYITENAWGTRNVGMLGVLAKAQLGWGLCSVYRADPASPTTDMIAGAMLTVAPGVAWAVTGTEYERLQDARVTESICGEATCTALRGTALVQFATAGIGPKETPLPFIEDVLALTRAP